MSTPQSEGEHRAQVLLAVLAGQQSVADAATALGLSEPRVYQLRDKAQAALAAACEPGQPGRPAKDVLSPDAVRVRELEEANAELQFELEAQQLRQEIALILPHVLEVDPRPPPPAKKKTRRPKGRDGR